jgi:transcriptional regulator with XRE-family HTH domain
VEIGRLLRDVRKGAGLTQGELAELAGTSQATLSAYERERKAPTAPTLARLLAAVGMRLTVSPATRRVVSPSARELERRARILSQVLGLAESLPTRHDPETGFPPLRSVIRDGSR